VGVEYDDKEAKEEVVDLDKVANRLLSGEK